MAHAVRRTEPDSKELLTQSEGDERRAPNGRIAVLVNGMWAGFLCEDGGGSRGGSGRDMAVFDVEELPEKQLRATFRASITGKDKRSLSKRFHHDQDIKLYAATTPSGDRCQLFTL